MSKNKTTDLSGQNFGRWTVLRRHSRGRQLCRCECGVIRPVWNSRLKDGRSRSCGCLASERITEANKTHGLSHLPEYGVWVGMIKRCEYPHGPAFKNHGARGISVCHRWRESFSDFYADMGPRPTPDHQIERNDNDGDYEPDNCRWATRKEQAHNRRTNRIISYNGDSKTLGEWAEGVSINPSSLAGRLRRGWTLEAALTTPKMR